MTDTAERTVRASTESEHASVSIESVLDVQEKSPYQRFVANQSFWVTVALVAICLGMSWIEPRFATEDNFYNITRNFAFIGIMALGMTPVIITGGIDLSVGSVMGVVAIVSGSVLLAETPEWMVGWWPEAAWAHSWWMAIVAGLAAGAIVGLINGTLIAYVGLPPFVVTLGMLAAARAVGVILSGNRMLYDFRPGAEGFKIIGGGWNLGFDLPFRLSNPFIIMILLTLALAVVLRMATWGR